MWNTTVNNVGSITTSGRHPGHANGNLGTLAAQSTNGLAGFKGTKTVLPS